MNIMKMFNERMQTDKNTHSLIPFLSSSNTGIATEVRITIPLEREDW